MTLVCQKHSKQSVLNVIHVVPCLVSLLNRVVNNYHLYMYSKTVAIDTPDGKRNLKMKIKAQQMTFRQDITKYKIYWLTFLCIVHNIFRAIKLIYKRVLYIYK
jgi:hypothetical protein